MKQRALALILTAAMTLRLLNAVFLPWQGGDLVVSDMKGYDRAAIALLQQKPLSVHTAERYIYHPLGSDTYHPAGYYYFLAGIYTVAGHSYLAIRLVQALIDTLTCLLIFLLGRDTFGEGAGLLGAALAAVYPPLIFYSGVLLTETVSTFLLTCALWVTVRYGLAVGDRSTWLLVGAGLLVGCSALIRSVLLLVVPGVLVWLLFVAGHWPGWIEASRRKLALVVPIVLVIAPITIRNYQIHHRFIPISTNGGVNFFLGHGGTERLKNQVRNIPEHLTDDPLIGVSNRTEPEEEACFYQLGWEYIRQRPARTARALPDKFAEMYWASDYWPASDSQAQILRSLDIPSWRVLVLPLSLLGLVLFRSREQRRAALLYLIALSSVAVPLIFWAQPRFRMPFVPCFILLAAGAACELYRRLSQQRKSRLERRTS